LHVLHLDTLPGGRKGGVRRKEDERITRSRQLWRTEENACKDLENSWKEMDERCVKVRWEGESQSQGR
jgi:hypothetical protein